MTGTLSEAPRKRRTAYRSGRLEMIGFKIEIPGKENKTDRKVRKERRNPISRSPWRSRFRWKKG